MPIMGSIALAGVRMERTATPIRRIAICTGGGDAPGLNAVIRAVVLASGRRGWECYGIRDGFNGICFRNVTSMGVVRLTRDKVRNIGHLGGTVIGTTNRGNPFHFPTRMPDGSVGRRIVRTRFWRFCPTRDRCPGVGGGDGSLTIANACTRRGCGWWGPKTIDNDLRQDHDHLRFRHRRGLCHRVHR